MNKKLVFIFVLMMLLWSSLLAQKNTSNISGTVTDKANKQAIEFASVQLLKITDSAVVSTTMTDKKGRFTLTDIASGNYILQYNFIGYEKSNQLLSVSYQQNLNVGRIEIFTLPKSLDEVTVTAQKSMLISSIDRKIYNVSQDIMAQSGTASDVLKNIPSLEVDIDGNVSLRGSGDVIILINGKPSPLMGRTRAEVLQQFPANTIERIEVTTNPSAKYRPDGTSGIINIVLKKNSKLGWNGTATFNAGNRSRQNGSFNMNYKPGKLNLFGNYAVRHDRRFRYTDINREYLDSVGKALGYYTENNQSPSNPLSHFVTLGAEYTINNHNRISLSGNYYTRKLIKQDVVKKLFYGKNYLITSAFNRLRYDPETEEEYDATANWQHNFNKEDHELSAEFTASSSKDKEDNSFTNVYSYPATANSFDNTFIKQSDNQQQLQIDYTNPLSEDSQLEAGYAASFTQIDMNFYAEYFDAAQGKFVNDIAKTNHYKYWDAIHAVYGTWQRSYEKIGYSVGLRAEQAFIKGNLITIDSLFNNSYFIIYPTLHLSYELENSEFQLNYSKRVNRPDGDEINPFPEYRDPQNIQAGNPKLLPEIIHSIELGYKWQNKRFSFVPSLYYRYKKNGFTEVTIPLNDSVLLTTDQNLSTDQSTGLELIFSAKAGKFFSANLSSNFFYNRIDASELGYSNKKSIVSMSTNFNSSFTVTKTTMLQVSCNYRSASLTPQGKTFASFVTNAGMRQDLFKKKVSVILTASDIFKTLQNKTELNSSYLKQIAVGKRDAQIFYLGISYRFGKTVNKNDEEKIEFDNNLR
ncbi:MAG: outer membrane beta-barrel family protein [Bacteroidota bacterium]|nr:outer membrane beta-barrel family protein [Bacteroidota bacterium]